MSTPDIEITNDFPGVQFNPLEDSINSLWHEDREITSTTAPIESSLYRVVNATLVKGATPTWNLKTPTGHATEFAYATVQDEAGSLHFYSSPPTTPGGSTPQTSWPLNGWVGSGNNTVYNAVDFGLVPGTGGGLINTPALAAAIAAAMADSGGAGGVVVIPAGTWYLDGEITITTATTNAVGLIIAGSAGGTQLVQTSDSPIFNITAFENGWGIRFKDLRLTYQRPTTADGVYAITIASGMGSSVENVTCERVYFQDCPGAFSTDNRATQCGLLDCTIDYDNTLSDQTFIALNGSQDFVRGCVIRENSSGPSGCIAIQIGSVSTCYLADNQISDMDNGLVITFGCVDLFVNNVRIAANTMAVYFLPSGGKIYHALFSNCAFACSSSTPTGSGIFVDTGMNPNSYVSGILFNNCICYGWGLAGLLINAGSDIVVTGGQYSGNGQAGGTANARAGIAISGGANVTISGVDCSGTEQLTGLSQAYGISVFNGGNATITNCNLTGNSSAALFTSSPGTLEVTNCTGYNDQNTALNGGSPPKTSALSAATCSTPYYGPSLVLFSNPTTLAVSVSGPSYSMEFGSIYLARPYDKIQFTGTTTSIVFNWLGK